MSFTLEKGYNFRILNTDEFGKICFGCPPGIVKDFSQREESLPSKYVLPLRTFVNGTNRFDFEFILYTYLFIKPGRGKVSIYCTQDQKNRFKAIFEETLFGPSFLNLLKSQFRRFGEIHKFTSVELEYYQAFIQKVAEDDELHQLFQKSLNDHVSDKEIQELLANYFHPLVEEEKWLACCKIHIKSIEQTTKGNS